MFHGTGNRERLIYNKGLRMIETSKYPIERDDSKKERDSRATQLGDEKKKKIVNSILLASEMLLSGPKVIDPRWKRVTIDHRSRDFLSEGIR